MPIGHRPHDIESIREVCIPGRYTNHIESCLVAPRRLLGMDRVRVHSKEDASDAAQSNPRQRPGAPVLAAKKLIGLLIRSKSLGNRVELQLAVGAPRDISKMDQS